MARIRTIKPTIWQSEQLANVPRDARLLFIGLISHADDDGRLRGAPALIRSEVFPYDDDITPAAIDELLAALEAVRLVVRYVVDDQRYIAIPTFASHQAISKRTASRLPEPPSDPTESTTTPGALPEDSGRTAGSLRTSSRTTPARKGKGREEASPLRASAREATPIVDVHEIDALFAPLGRAPDARTRRRCIAIAQRHGPQTVTAIVRRVVDAQPRSPMAYLHRLANDDDTVADAAAEVAHHRAEAEARAADAARVVRMKIAAGIVD